MRNIFWIALIHFGQIFYSFSYDAAILQDKRKSIKDKLLQPTDVGSAGHDF